MQLVHDFIYTAAYPITLVALLVVGLFMSPLSRVPISLRCIYIVLMVLCVPYGFLVWLASITADLYDNPIHNLNLFLILIFDALVLTVIISYFRRVKTIYFNSKVWLYSPWIVFSGSLGCFFYLLMTK